MDFSNLATFGQLNSPQVPAASSVGASSLFLAVPLLISSITNQSTSFVPAMSQNLSIDIVNGANSRLPQMFWGFLQRPRPSSNTTVSPIVASTTESPSESTTTDWSNGTWSTTESWTSTTESANETTTAITPSDTTKNGNSTEPTPSPSDGDNIRLHRNCGFTVTELESGSNNIQDRIVGGTPTAIDDVPWQVSLQRTSNGFQYSPFCGGSVIHPQWIVTAAHCLSWINNSTSDSSGTSKGGWYPGFYNLVYSNPISRLKVRAGTSDLFVQSSSQRFRHARFRRQSAFMDTLPFFDRSVLQVIIHPNYTSGEPFNDIALIQLNRPLPLYPFARINTICLPKSTINDPNVSSPQWPFDFEIGTVSGWGRTTEGGSSSSVLQSVNVTIVNNSVCQRVYGTNYNSIQMICAGDSGKDSCQGDSGGPFFKVPTSANNSTTLRRNLDGIVSFGFGCGRTGFPGIYSRVSNYVFWITQNVLQNNE